jgi:hypothetical protein
VCLPEFPLQFAPHLHEAGSKTKQKNMNFFRNIFSRFRSKPPTEGTTTPDNLNAAPSAHNPVPTPETPVSESKPLISSDKRAALLRIFGMNESLLKNPLYIGMFVLSIPMIAFGLYQLKKVYLDLSPFF